MVGVRQGDLFAVLVRYCYAAGDAAQAHGLMEEMALRGLSLGPYLGEELVAAVCEVRVCGAGVVGMGGWREAGG